MSLQNRLAPLWLVLTLLVFAGTAHGDGKVKTMTEDWVDAARRRTVPVKIYYPAAWPEKPCPVVLFSHGLGGSRNAASYLGNAWASHGYVSVHLQHIGSDESLWRDGQQAKPGEVRQRLQVGMTAQTYRDRVEDVKFAIDQLEKLNANGSSHVLAKRLDLSRIAMTGQSYGAQTTQSIAGQIGVLPTGRELTGWDERVDCAIALSPAPPQAAGQVETAFSKMKMPVLWMTGTQDTSPMREMKPEERRIPFEKTTAKAQYLIVLNDADHATFGGNGAKAATFGQTIERATLAFLDAYLRGDADKQASLATDLKKIVDTTGTVDSK